jgi:hypothetical protein
MKAEPSATAAAGHTGCLGLGSVHAHKAWRCSGDAEGMARIAETGPVVQVLCPAIKIRALNCSVIEPMSDSEVARGCLGQKA